MPGARISVTATGSSAATLAAAASIAGSSASTSLRRDPGSSASRKGSPAAGSWSQALGSRGTSSTSGWPTCTARTPERR